MNIGFIGLGNMGNPMAGRLIQAGFDLVVFDAKQEMLEAFVKQHGGTAAGSVKEVGQKSAAVITMLPNGDIVRRVALGDGGAEKSLAGSMAPGTLLVDMSSSSPTGTKMLGKRLAEQSISMVDAPVSGGVSRAQTGKLAIMVGGSKGDIERCRPLFQAMGTSLFETGDLGSAHAMKVLNNLVSAAGMVAAAEALLVGARFGLKPSVMIDVFNASTGRNNSTENKFNQFIFSRKFNSGFSLENMVKDLTLAMELARDTDTPIPLGVMCRELWSSAKKSQKPSADHTEVVRWYEDLLKTELS